jgi:hypothetical protein
LYLFGCVFFWSRRWFRCKTYPNWSLKPCKWHTAAVPRRKQTCPNAFIQLHRNQRQFQQILAIRRANPILRHHRLMTTI